MEGVFSRTVLIGQMIYVYLARMVSKIKVEFVKNKYYNHPVFLDF
jgi:hypothetical protein